MSEITTVIEPKRPIHLIGDNDSPRYQTGILIEPSGRDDTVLCVAQNGRAMAVTQESGRTDAAVLAPLSAFKAKTTESVEITKNGVWRKVTRSARGLPTSTELPDIDGRFPQWRCVLPDITFARTVQVSLDATLLATLARSLGASDKPGLAASKVTLFLPIADNDTRNVVQSAISVLYQNEEIGNAIGVFMPCEADKENPADLMTTEKRAYCDFIKAIPQPK